MLHLNKYLKEIGYTEKSFPFEGHNKKDKRYKPDEDGFRAAEFYSLDHTFNLYIYSHLCYFREHIADSSTPGPFLFKDGVEDYENGHKRWLKLVDKIIFGLKLEIIDDEKEKQKLLKTNKTGTELDKLVTKKACRARELLVKYWYCFWY